MMNNLTILIELEDKKSDTLNKVVVFFKEVLIDKKFDVSTQVDIITGQKGEDILIVEYKNIKDSTNYLVNVFYNNKLNKKEFLLELRLSELIVNHTVLFDNGSNFILQRNSNKIMQLENLIKYYVTLNIAHFHADDVFDVINDLKVKEDLNTIQFQNQITSIQRMELKSLISYIKDHLWGGREIEILRDYYFARIEGDNTESNEELENSQEIKEYISKNIFKELIDDISSSRLGNVLYEWRNSIAHNRCVEEEVFENISKKIETLKEKILNTVKNANKKHNCFNEKIVNEFQNIPDFAYIIKTTLKNDNIVLRILEKINGILNIDMLSELRNSKIIKEDQNIFCSNNYVSIVLVKLNPEITTINDNENAYQLSIYMKTKERLKYSNINFTINELLNEISDKFIVMYDGISELLCNDLYVKINSLENLVRGYITLNEQILTKSKNQSFNKIALEKMNLKVSIDTDALKLKTNGTCIDLINNELFESDFIYLLEKLSNPLSDKKYTTILNDNTSTIDEFNKKIANLSDLDDNIKSIKNKWKELYRIRTMVAHNYIIYSEEYKNYEAIYTESLYEIQESIFNVLYENINSYYFDCDITSTITNNKFRITSLARKYNLDITVEESNTCYIFPQHFIWKILNSILELDLQDDSIILGKEFVEIMLLSNREKFDNILLNIDEQKCINNLMNITSGVINTKRNESENIRILEDLISSILKEFSSEINI